MDHDNADGAEYDGAVDVLKLGNDALADVFGFFLVRGGVAGEGRENGDAAPFGAFVECDEEFVEDGGCDDEEGGVGGG